MINCCPFSAPQIWLKLPCSNKFCKKARLNTEIEVGDNTALMLSNIVFSMSDANYGGIFAARTCGYCENALPSESVN